MVTINLKVSMYRDIIANSNITKAYVVNPCGSCNTYVNTPLNAIHGNTCAQHTSKRNLRCRKRRKEVSNTPPQTNTQMDTTNTTNKRAGQQMPSLENWGGGLKILHGANSPHTPSVQTHTTHTNKNTQRIQLHTYVHVTAPRLRKIRVFKL